MYELILLKRTKENIEKSKFIKITLYIADIERTKVNGYTNSMYYASEYIFIIQIAIYILQVSNYPIKFTSF